MPFGVAWSTLPSPAFERGFLQHHWRARGAWSPDDWFLNLMVELGGPADRLPVARCGGLRDPPHGGDRIVARARQFQGRGFGKEMRAAVLGLAFDGLGARVAETSAFLDNAASNGVSRALGYERERVRQPGARGRRARDAALPDDRRGLARPAAAAARDRGPRRLPRPVRGRA